MHMLRLIVVDPVLLRVHHAQPLYRDLPQIPQLVNLLQFQQELRLVLPEQHPDLLVPLLALLDLRINLPELQPVHPVSRQDLTEVLLQNRQEVQLQSRPDHLRVSVEDLIRILNQVARTDQSV